MCSADHFRSALEKAWHFAIDEYGKGRRFRTEAELRDFLYDRLVSELGSRTVRKETGNNGKRPDIIIGEDRADSVAVEIKCAVYETGTIHREDAERDLDKLVSYINEGFAHSCFLFFAEFEDQRKVTEIENRLRHIRQKYPQVHYEFFKPCSKMNFALGYDGKDPECISCSYVGQCRKFQQIKV